MQSRLEETLGAARVNATSQAPTQAEGILRAGMAKVPEGHDPHCQALEHIGDLLGAESQTHGRGA